MNADYRLGFLKPKFEQVRQLFGICSKECRQKVKDVAEQEIACLLNFIIEKLFSLEITTIMSSVFTVTLETNSITE